MIRASFQGQLGRFVLDVAFEAPLAGVTALFGPSGCGKTSVLRCAAGLQRLAGRFALGDETWQGVDRFLPAHDRPVGYVFQEASLFPHLRVERNLLFGDRRARTPPGRRRLALADVADLLGLGPLLARAPRHLSGGERQRVAIGRALLSQPALLLMDEPLSALDRPTRDEILPFLERLARQVGLPMLYVTHDMREVERLAEHVVLMEAGRVIGAGTLEALQSNPALPLLHSREAAVSLTARVVGQDAAYGLLMLEAKGGRFMVPAPASPPGEARRLRIGAGDVSVALGAPPASSIANVLPARILSATRTSAAEVTMVLGLGPAGDGDRLLSRVTLRSWDQLGLAEGIEVVAQVKGVALVAGG